MRYFPLKDFLLYHIYLFVRLITMSSPTRIVAIVPAKHHSQRVPGKNMRLLGPYPLYYHILNTLLQVPELDQVIVDTDSAEIAAGITQYFGHQITILDRPEHLRADTISMNQIIKSIVERLQLSPETLIVQTHVTNPFLTTNSISNMINDYTTKSSSDTSDTPTRPKYQTLMTVTGFQKRLWTHDGQPINHNPTELIQTQDLTHFYEENSCLYLFQARTILDLNHRLGQTQQFWSLSASEALDIDHEEDFQLAEAWYRHKSKLEAEASSVAPKVHTDEEIYDSLLRLIEPKFLSTSSLAQLKGQRVLISAPYMMANIEAFRRFFETDLNMKVIVAPVKERLSEEQLLTYTGQYDASLIGDDRYTEKVISTCGAKVISKWGTGIDSIDQDACRRHHIPLKNTPNKEKSEKILAFRLANMV